MMLERLLARLPGTPARRRQVAVADRVTRWGRALREPASDVATRNLAIARITGQTVDVRSGSPAHQPPTDADSDAGIVSLEATVQGWAEVLSSRGCTPYRLCELRDRLLKFARQLTEAAPEHLCDVASRIGRDLGQHLQVVPEAFEDFVEVAATWLDHNHAGRDAAGFPVRIKALAGLSGGFAAGVRARVLDEQGAMDTTLTFLRQQDQEKQLCEPFRFTARMATSEQPMAVLDRRGVLQRMNAPARDLLALQVGQRDVLLEDCTYTEPDCATIRSLIDDILDAGTVHLDFAVAWPEGTFKSWVRATLRWYPGNYENPGRICAVFEDATVLYAWRRQLDRWANTDDATNLPSRHSFLTHAQATLETATGQDGDTPVGICAIRLVGLTRITRELGPRHGDIMLTALADRITGAVSGTPGTSIARLGRDAFAVLLADPHSWASVSDMVKRLSAWLSEPIRVDNHHLTVIPRVGVAEGHPGHITATELLDRAEAALDSHTTTRRPWTIIDDTDTTRHHRHAHLLAALPAALVHGQLSLAYSPIATVSTGVISGLRVHTYWHHPEHGDLLVDDLIELADDIGLTLPLSQWTLQHAAHHAATWRRMFPTNAPFIHLDIPHLLADTETFHDHVRDALIDTGLPPHLLHLAIPGNALLDDRHRTPLHLTAIHDIGASLMLTGTGTTFSRYHKLPHLPLHGLVLPPELTTHLRPTPRKPRTVTHTLINLATDLDLTTHLTHITTPEQLHDARLTTATHAHGTLIGHPLPPEDIDTLLYNRPADLPHNQHPYPQPATT